MGKYTPLTQWLINCPDNKVSLSFEEIENIIHCKLPPSAYKYVRWWINDKEHVQGKSWLKAGYEVINYSRAFETHNVEFQKVFGRDTAKEFRVKSGKDRVLKDYAYKKNWYNSESVYNNLVDLFLKSNSSFLDADLDLFSLRASERSMCGALMYKLNNHLIDSPFFEYYADIEFNRNEGGKVKTIINDKFVISSITCDLIVHSRGVFPEQDNLIAIEMKKATRPESEKTADKNRLIALTKGGYNDNVWSYDGKSLPEHVCRYILGIYYEINSDFNEIYLEFYYHGNKVNEHIINIIN